MSSVGIGGGPARVNAGTGWQGPEPGRAKSLSRVTLVAERRRVDLVLPAHEPVGELMPEVLRLLDDSPLSRPMTRRLVTAGGAVLAQDQTLAEAEVADGTVLRLVRGDEAPAAPVVHDVADAAAEDLDRRSGRWNEKTRVWTAGGGALVLGLVAAVLAWGWYGAETVGPWLLGVALVSAGAGALASRLTGGREAGAILILLAGTLGVIAAWLLTNDMSQLAARLLVTGLPVVCLLGLLGVFTDLGRGGFAAAGMAVLLLGGWALAVALTSSERSGIVLGSVSVLALGLLPRYALMTAGLTRLDDARAGDVSVSRHHVDAALAATHRGLALATVGMGLSAAVAGWLALSGGNGPSTWGITVTALLAIILLSRSRAFPLAVEMVALLAAGAVLAVRLVLVWAERSAASGEMAPWPLAAACGIAVTPLLLLVVRPPDHVRVRLRRLMNFAESFGTVMLVPVAIGAFGVYDRLLDTF